jgi:hypothetical protein
MVEYAKKIASAMDRRLPDDVMSDFEKCMEFIDANKAILDIPSEKQLKFAESLAQQNGVPVPDELKHDRRGLSAWIDAQKQKA